MREQPTQPAPQQPTDREQIEAVLAAYANAYSRRDADAVARVQPSIDVDDLRDQFNGASSFTVKVVTIHEIRITGDTAVVQTTLYQDFRASVGTFRREGTLRSDFMMRKAGGTWIIERRTNR